MLRQIHFQVEMQTLPRETKGRRETCLRTHQAEMKRQDRQITPVQIGITV
jgi:hypothetical protein